jgi:Putative zinc-finger
MSHLDEGQLTALVDNELTAAERSTVEAHLMACEDCRRLYEEVKAFATEADGLVTAIELPARGPHAPLGASSVARPANRHAAEPPGGTPSLPGPAEESPWGARSPSRRGVWSPRWRTVAWAASVLLAVGLGWVASDIRLSRRRLTLGEEKRDSAPAAAAAEPVAPEPQPAATLRSQVEEKVAPAEYRRGKRADELAADRPAPTPPEPSRQALAPAAAPPSAGAAAAAAETDGQANLGLLARKSVAPQAAAGAESAPTDAVTQRHEGGFRQVEMKEAVRVLSGSIRLVDGLQPERVLEGPGELVRGADLALPLIRVVYRDPPGRELWLDQQRPAEGEGARLRDSRSGVLVGDTTVTRGPTGSTSIHWIDEHGFRLALTGFLAADSLNALIRRVH